MKKHRSPSHRHHSVKAVRRDKPEGITIVAVRSWMLLVMFALMLGLGAVVGTYLNVQSANSTPTVAGAETAR